MGSEMRSCVEIYTRMPRSHVESGVPFNETILFHPKISATKKMVSIHAKQSTMAEAPEAPPVSNSKNKSSSTTMSQTTSSTPDTTVSPNTQSLPKDKKKKTTKTRFLLILMHALSLLPYLIPLLTHDYDGKPVLDESHIVSAENKDTMGTSPWWHALMNDYWGRPMISSSSHKSWRPLTVWSFRYMGTTLLQHRLFNVVTHAAAAEVVSLLACQMMLQNNNNQSSFRYSRVLVKWIFLLHPTHVEVVANAANRPHLLACLFAATLCDPSLHIILVMILMACGLLSSETFLFSTPAILLTLTYLQLTETTTTRQATRLCLYIHYSFAKIYSDCRLDSCICDWTFRTGHLVDSRWTDSSCRKSILQFTRVGSSAQLLLRGGLAHL